MRSRKPIRASERREVAGIFLIACCALSIALLLPGCRREEQPTVILFVSADEHLAKQVIDAFEKESGIPVLMVGDTEAKKTSGLVERIKAEAQRPQADVFWSSEIFMTIELAEAGLLEQHWSDSTMPFERKWRDEKAHWHGFAARGRVIAYSPQRVPPDAVPRTWMDLRDERFRGRIVMADPRFGTTGGHLGAMKAYWSREVGPGYYEAFLEALADNDVRLLPSGNAGVVAAIISGEADIGLTDTDDVWAAQARGGKAADVAMAFPDHTVDRDEPGNGTLLIPNTVARVKGGPNPEQAKALIDFLLSEKVERMLAESVSHNMPLRPGLADKYIATHIADPLDVDYQAAARMREGAIKQAMRAFDVGEEPKPPPLDRAAIEAADAAADARKEDDALKEQDDGR